MNCECQLPAPYGNDQGAPYCIGCGRFSRGGDPTKQIAAALSVASGRSHHEVVRWVLQDAARRIQKHIERQGTT